MLKKFISTCLIISCIFYNIMNVFGAYSYNPNDFDEIEKIDLSIDNTEYLIQEGKMSRAYYAPYDTVKIKSKEYSSSTFGDWRIGATGTGPASLSINDSTSINRSFTATINGSTKVGESTLGASLGVTIGQTKTYGTAYSISIASGERKTIIFRPKIVTYKVTEEITTYTYNSTYNAYMPYSTKTNIVYVNTFDNWDYSWRYGY